jgi:predicted acylesterase/phospholipase RssA
MSRVVLLSSYINGLSPAYIDEQEKALIYIRESPDLSSEEKKRFFKGANTNLGTSALCLSGGASFGYCTFTGHSLYASLSLFLLDHFGVVKAFLDEGLLPRVITGTSAGGPIASLVCTRTNEELKQLLVPQLANRITACDEPFRVWFRRFWSKGARFDSIQLARKVSCILDK